MTFSTSSRRSSSRARNTRILSAGTLAPVIREISSNPEFGYGNPADRVLAMELERDADGRIQPEFRRGYDQTQGAGKTRNIRRFLVPRYGYGPAFVAGDSEGDQNMMADFPETKKVLIVNRLRAPSTDIGKFSAQAVRQYGQADARYLLQGRNDNTGDYWSLEDVVGHFIPAGRQRA